MESIPIEIVEKISEHLTPEDLARCCGVSRIWREIFNHDWLWKPHCNPAVEEHLRTTPCVVEPAFVTPGGEDSTLAAISQWRLAFLREKHLHNNWKHNYHKKVSVSVLSEKSHREFLTNTLVVRWCHHYVEVWNVIEDPAVLVGRTDPSVIDVSLWIGCAVTEGSLLVVQQADCVKILFVDVMNNCIQLRHDIPLDDVRGLPVDYMLQLHHYGFYVPGIKGLNCIKGNTLLHVNVSRSRLDIFDLETGEKVKEESCPVMGDGIKRCEIFGISTFQSSDYVMVVVKLDCEENPSGLSNGFYYIYNPKKLSFLPGPILAKEAKFPDYGEMYSHYLAIHLKDDFIIYDCHSRETLLKIPIGSNGLGFYCSGANDYFVFKGPVTSTCPTLISASLVLFSLSNLTWIPVSECMNFRDFKVFNNKLLSAFSHEWVLHFLIGNTWAKCDLEFFHQPEINQTSTKVLSRGSLVENVVSHLFTKKWYMFIHHYW